MKLPQTDRPYTLSTDFSSVAISAVLEQQHSDNKLHVIAYASRCCNAAESKYGSNEGEFLALVFAVTKFHHYLARAVFTIVTDNGALQYLEGHRSGSPKLTRWAMLLANYDFKVKFRPGKSNGNADGLSRANQLPTEDTTPSSFTCTATPACPDLPLTLDTLAATIYSADDAE